MIYFTLLQTAMLLDFAYSILLVMSLASMLSLLMLKSRRIEHLLYAIFSGSLAMVSVEWHSAELTGSLAYLAGFGTSATCSVVWLIAIALFRPEGSLKRGHYLFAAAITALVIFGHGIETGIALQWLSSDSVGWLDQAISQLATLFSSTVLMLTLWEAVNVSHSEMTVQKWQRILFSGGYFVAVFNCIVIAPTFYSPQASVQAFPWFVVTSAMLVMSVCYAVILWQYKLRLTELKTTDTAIQSRSLESTEIQALYFDIEAFMRSEEGFLQPELKILDIAAHLNVSEYKVSHAIRLYSSADNFNQFVNAYRLEHARQCLADPAQAKLTILAIAMDAGFASIAPFNRAFKASEGCTPNQYRRQQASGVTR